MAKDVIDRDRGYKAALARLLDAEGLQVRIGILSAVPRYPKAGSGKKGQQVAKVAAVHGMVKAFADIWDKTEGRRNEAINAAHFAILSGQSPAMALVRVGELHRDAMRREVDRRKLIATGRLRATIRSAVFDGSKRVAGDVHNRPRASDPV
jgi:hypothetical protein